MKVILTILDAASSGGTLDMVTLSAEVTKMIDELSKGFRILKNNIRECLEKHQIHTKEVADVLTSLSPDEDEQHTMFTESHIKDLYGAADISEQFGTMNSHWDYLNPPLLDHLVQQFDLQEVRDQMEAYKSDLQQFRMKTPLNLFCHTQKRKNCDPPQNFRKAVIHFDWRNGITLEDVEQFRQRYASKYGLHECAMMIAEIRHGSYIITCFIPESIVEKLKTEIPRNILKDYCVTKLEIAGACVYRPREAQKVSGTDCNGSVE